MKFLIQKRFIFFLFEDLHVNKSWIAILIQKTVIRKGIELNDLHVRVHHYNAKENKWYSDLWTRIAAWAVAFTRAANTTYKIALVH